MARTVVADREYKLLELQRKAGSRAKTEESNWCKTDALFHTLPPVIINGAHGALFCTVQAS